MALIINKIQQSSGRTPAGEDFLSGMFFYGDAPTGGSVWKEYNSSLVPNLTIKAKQLFSTDDCEPAGIVAFSDNTASTGKIQIRTIGATDDSIAITATVPVIGDTNDATEILDLGTYVVLSTDTTKPLQAAGLAAAINANTYLTGFSATDDGVDSVTIAADKKYGKSLNTGTVYVRTLSVGSVMVTVITQNVIAGTGSQFAVWKYHIDEYFRMNPTGNVWVGVVDDIYDFTELIVLQSASGNTIRLLGIWDSVTDDDITTKQPLFQKLQAAAMVLDGVYPFEAIYTFDMTTVDLADCPNGQLYKYNKVTIPISQDGMAYGNFLFRTIGQSIGNMGAKLGTLSKSRVSSDDAQPTDPFFNLSDGTENNVPAFANGQLMEEVQQNLLTQLAARRYIFFQTYTGNTPGTYWNDNWCWCVQTHRYAFMNDNRIASKVTRICQKTYTPLLKSEVIYNDDGTISDFSVEIFQDAGVDAITAECITGFGSMPLISGAPIVTVDPAQPLQQTNNLQIVVKVGENGIARDITISQGFTN